MAVTEFKNLTDVKKQPVPNIKERFGGFPVPMGKQMSQVKPPTLKLRFPKPKRMK